METQGCSWHGTAIQVVLATRCMIMREVSHGQDQETVQHAELLNPTSVGKKRATRPVSELSPTLTSKSPAYNKVTRRSRSLAEYKTPVRTGRWSLFSTVNADAYVQLSYNHYSTLKSNHSLQEFCLMESAKKELSDLEDMAFLYTIYRGVILG